MKISGANLEETEVQYSGLSNIKWTDNLEIQRIILNLEKLYYQLLSRKEEQRIQSFPIDGNGKVIIKPGMVNHRCSNELEKLNFISQYGILASEWFGVLESEREACFCSFVSRMKGKDYLQKGDFSEDDYSRLNIGKNIVLFFDDTNPIMQYLLHLDYFEYEYIKKSNPSEIDKLYTKEEIDLFEKLIEPLSPGGKDMRRDFDFKTNYWSAIPGGIPPFLINGICIKKNDYTEEQLDEINKMFPNAIIFKNDLDIVRYPIIENVKKIK